MVLDLWYHSSETPIEKDGLCLHQCYVVNNVIISLPIIKKMFFFTTCPDFFRVIVIFEVIFTLLTPIYVK